jgi:hypothetical protein
VVAIAKTTITTQEILNKNHGIIALNMRVLMKRGIYPKLWRSKK